MTFSGLESGQYKNHHSHKMELRVSIVIPTYNRAHLLQQTIDSCLSQTYPCEIIVVNHGSTDNTDEIVLSYGEQVKYIKSEQDFGPHYCWLDGVMQCTADYVHLQYDDDWLQPSYIEKVMTVMTEETGLAFSMAVNFHTETGESNPVFSPPFQESGIYTRKQVEKYLLANMISPGAMIYRKQDLIDALYQGKLPIGDAHFHGVGPDCFVTLLCLLRYPKIGFIKEPLSIFRSHEGSITVNAYKDQTKQQQILAAYKDVTDFYHDLKWIKLKRRAMRLLGKSK